MIFTMATKPRSSRAKVEAALQNLIKKGLIVSQVDDEGHMRYYAKEYAPTLTIKGPSGNSTGVDKRSD
jgi:hypothetical protein